MPNWVGEAKRFAPDLRVVGIDETSKKKRKALSTMIGEAELVVTSYALFRLDYESYAGIQWSGFLLDEAQFVKNRQSATHQLARRLDDVAGPPLPAPAPRSLDQEVVTWS